MVQDHERCRYGGHTIDILLTRDQDEAEENCEGRKVNEEKLDTVGKRTIEFVGIKINLKSWTVSIMSKTVEKIRRRYKEVLRRYRMTKRTIGPREN